MDSRVYRPVLFRGVARIDGVRTTVSGDKVLGVFDLSGGPFPRDGFGRVFVSEDVLSRVVALYGVPFDCLSGRLVPVERTPLEGVVFRLGALERSLRDVSVDRVSCYEDSVAAYARSCESIRRFL